MAKPPPDEPAPTLAERYAAAWAMWREFAFLPDHPNDSGDLDPMLAGDALKLLNAIYDEWNDYHRSNP